MRVTHDHFGGIAGVVDEDFLCRDQDVHGMAVGLDVECAVGRELQKIQAGEVAGGIVQEHVFAAGIAGINARAIFRSVPAIYRGVVLHSGIAAVPGGFGDFLEKILCFVCLHDAAIANRLGGKIGVADYGVHEVVGDADGVVGVLEKDGRVSVGVGMRAVVSHGYERVGLGFFVLLAQDEIFDIRMVDVEDDHLGGAAGFASRLDYSRKRVKTFHEAERTAGCAPTAQAFG